MINFMRTMDTYCNDCMENGEFLPLQFVMLNITSGMWTCPKTECVFPMNSPRLKEFMEDDLSTERVLFLMKKYGKRSKKKKKQHLSKESLKSFESTSLESSSRSSETKFSSSRTTPSSLSSRNTSSKNSSASSSRKSSSFSARKPKFLYPTWESEGLRCWLHAELSLLVLNKTLNEEMKKIKSYTMLGDMMLHYQKITMSYNLDHRNYRKIAHELNEIRETALSFLHPKIFSLYSDEDSPLFSLPLIIKTGKKIHEKLEVEYQCEFRCTDCGFSKNDGFNRLIMTLPNSPVDCNFTDNLYCTRPCYRCNSASQKTVYKIEKYPLVLFCHFREGVSSNQFWLDYSFVDGNGEKYIVTQIVQYIVHKKHFVLWAYDMRADRWLLADDLGDNAVGFTYKKPDCQPREVHLLVWEKESNLKSLAETSPPDITHDMELDTRPPSRASSVASETYSPIESPVLPTVSNPDKKKGRDLKTWSLDRFKPYLSRKEREKQREISNAESAKLTSNVKLKNLHLSNAKLDVLPSSVKNSPLYERENSNEILSHVQEIFSQELDDDFFENLSFDANKPTESKSTDETRGCINTSLSNHLEDELFDSINKENSDIIKSQSNLERHHSININLSDHLDDGYFASLNYDDSTINNQSDHVNNQKEKTLCYEEPFENYVSEMDNWSSTASKSNTPSTSNTKQTKVTMDTEIISSSGYQDISKALFKKKKSKSKRESSQTDFSTFIDTMFVDIERQQVADVLISDDVVNDDNFDIGQILSGNVL